MPEEIDFDFIIDTKEYPGLVDDIISKGVNYREAIELFADTTGFQPNNFDINDLTGEEFLAILIRTGLQDNAEKILEIISLDSIIGITGVTKVILN